MMKLDRIRVNPARMNGQPCIRNLRLTVKRVIELVALHPDRGELLREYPELEDEDIRQALTYAATYLDDRSVTPSLQSEADCDAALAEIERLFDAAPNTSESDRLDVLTTLVEAYEMHHYPIPEPDPVEAIKYYMESRGLSRADLEPYIGGRARVAEVLNRKRALSLNMIRRLYAGLGIPAEVLVKSYAVAEEKTTYGTS